MRACPFCKCSNTKVMSKVVVGERGDRKKYSVRCMQCNARGPIRDNEVQATYAWEGKTPDTGWNTKNLFSGE